MKKPEQLLGEAGRILDRLFVNERRDGAGKDLIQAKVRITAAADITPRLQQRIEALEAELAEAKRLNAQRDEILDGGAA